MQTKLNFNRELVIYGHLQADLRLAEEKLKKANNSLRAYRGWKTKRKKLLTTVL